MRVRGGQSALGVRVALRALVVHRGLRVQSVSLAQSVHQVVRSHALWGTRFRCAAGETSSSWLVSVGNYFLYALLICFGIYEAVMHFALKNERGNETLSHIVERLEEKRWWVRALTALALVALFLHLVLQLF